ncbi:MAG: hypothetical protein GY778_27775 [bacterium]|nr:hypothetical protein [bacterium]
MGTLLKRLRLIVVLAGAAPLVTVATCDRSTAGGHFVLNSTNDNLVEDAIDFLFDHDDDDDDDD